MAIVGIASCHPTQFNLSIILTGDVKGAVYPLNKWGTQCTQPEMLSCSCDCLGDAVHLMMLMRERLRMGQAARAIRTQTL